MLVTLDGFIDHMAMIADEELHKYAANLLNTLGNVVDAIGHY